MFDKSRVFVYGATCMRVRDSNSRFFGLMSVVAVAIQKAEYRTYESEERMHSRDSLLSQLPENILRKAQEDRKAGVYLLDGFMDLWGGVNM